MDVNPEAVVGRTLGRFTVRAVVGSGLFGTVYRAWDPHYRAERALKALHRVPEHDQAMQDRLWRDILTAAQVRHPRIVPIFDVFEADGVVCVAMELVSGRDLRELLRERRLTLAEVSRIVREAADGLDAALSAGVQHRDLKPANVLLREPDGGVMLSDFGLVWPGADGTVASSGPISESIRYWAPEQFQRGLEVDWRADIYGLSAIAYEMLTGRAPGRPPEPASRLSPRLPVRVDRVLETGLARDRSLRPDWPGTLAGQLAETLTEERTVAVDALPAASHQASSTPLVRVAQVVAGDTQTTVAAVGAPPSLPGNDAPTNRAPAPTPPAQPPASPPTPGPPTQTAFPPVPPRRRLRRLWPTAALVALAATLGGAGLALAHYAAPAADAPPIGVTDAQILKAVDTKLHECADNSLSDPAATYTCPQQGDHYNERLPTWRLAGQPTAAANTVIHYRGNDEFTVSGRYVMVLLSLDNFIDFPQVDASAYLATVRWTNGHLEVPLIQHVRQGPKIPRPPEATDHQAQIALSVLWTDCAPKRNLTAMNCPSPVLEPCGRVTNQFSLRIDQAGTPEYAYDATTGILKARGRYQVTRTATSTTPGCPPAQTAGEKGTYEVWMVFDGSFFQVVNGIYKSDIVS